MGLATAKLFLSRGWSVIGLDVGPTRALQGEDGFIEVQGDVRDYAGLSRELKSVLGTGARLDAVANIAGIYPPTTLDTYEEETYRRVFDINVLGVLNVIKAARPYLSDNSSIINFASVDAFTVSPGQLLYGASKAAVVMLTKSLSLELAESQIRVNAIAPGWVATPGNAATGRMSAAAASIPLGRVAEPEEIAQWVFTLADSGHSGFMTGETIVLSGGDVLR